MPLRKESKGILRTFLGASTSDEEVDSNENYWLLIEQRGNVVGIEDGKALVLFDTDLDALHLENHNQVKNALWILVSDLESQSLRDS
jgi:hypothetical protein